MPHDDDDNQRRLPPPIHEKLIDNQWRNGQTRQDKVPRPPIHAIKIKADELRAQLYNGKPLDWSDIHERFIDLWQEARLSIWRAKHSKAGLKVADPITGKSVLTFVTDEKLVLQAIDTTRGILDSLIKLRREMDPDAARIPGWAIEKIELALRKHPDALAELLKTLAEEQDTKIVQ